MKTKIKSNKIASVILAVAPIVPLAMLFPSGEAMVGTLAVAALAGLGYMELRGGAAASMPRQPKGSIQLYRHSKSEV